MTAQAQAVEALRRLLIEVQAGTVRVVDVRYSTQTASAEPFEPTGQETVTIILRREA
jgi:hypothetical protein